jgi:predicted amidophosphoribosyltransferase
MSLAAHEPGSPAATPGPAEARPWEALRARVRAATAGLPPVPEPGPGVCACCHGPARRGYARCFHCGVHAESAPGLLADIVAPVACAPKGSRLATDLWVYKSARAGAREAGATLLAMLLVFLHDEAQRVWQRAGVPPPTCACVVPSRRGRPGPHPLQALVRGCLALPWVTLLARPGADAWARMLDPGWFRAPYPLTGAAVLLLDDTWTSGGTAQSAAVALRCAGARSVTVVVAGRHLPALPASGGEDRTGPGPAGQKTVPAPGPLVNSLDS